MISQAADSSALETQIADLIRQVGALEQKVAALEQQASRARAPFEVVDGAGKMVFRVEVAPSGPLLTVGGAGAGSVALGLGNSKAGFLVVRAPDGTDGVAIGQLGGQSMGVHVLDAAGQKAIATLGTGPSGPALSVGDPETGGVSAGVGASGTGFVLVRQPNGSDGVGIGRLQGSPMGLYVLDTTGDRPIVELASDASGGGALTVSDSSATAFFRVGEKVAARDARVTIGAGEGLYGVNISGPSGSRLAALGEAGNGAGAVSIFDPSGSQRAVMNGLQGEVHVIDASGATRATMVAADDQGAFSVRNASGTTVLRLGEGTGGGLLQLADSGGNAMFEAGIHPSGVGLVRVYPVGSPGAGMIGMPGTFLLGKIGGK